MYELGLQQKKLTQHEAGGWKLWSAWFYDGDLPFYSVMGRGLLLSLQYPDICISTANCLKREADWTRPAGAEGPGVRNPAVLHSYSTMGPQVILGLLVEARYRKKTFLCNPEQSHSRFQQLNEKTLLVLRRICSFWKAFCKCNTYKPKFMLSGGVHFPSLLMIKASILL